jgi:phage terminase small subunit
METQTQLTRNPKPKFLSAKAMRHWNRISAEYELTPDAAMILETGLENWDMAQDARALLRKEGLVLNGRRHPAIEIQKLGDMIFLRSMRELGLNISDPGDVGRPPDALGIVAQPARPADDTEQERLF